MLIKPSKIFFCALVFQTVGKDGESIMSVLVKGYTIEAGAYLHGADLSGADLRGLDLSGAYLWEANLSSANLSEANLKGAKLAYIDLTNADLSNSTLTNAYLLRADLKSANLKAADLSGATLQRADLSNANLLQTNLSGADLAGAIVSNGNFLDANLAGANIYETKGLEGIPSEVFLNAITKVPTPTINLNQYDEDQVVTANEFQSWLITNGDYFGGRAYPDTIVTLTTTHLINNEINTYTEKATEGVWSFGSGEIG